jgi:hypothetical protein
MLYNKADVLKGLKSFRRIAKQDLIASENNPDAQFWYENAVARREKYAELIEIVEKEGVETAYKKSLEDYTTLPSLSPADEKEHPDLSGFEQALENFFTLLGVDKKTRREAKSRRIPIKNREG